MDYNELFEKNLNELVEEEIKQAISLHGYFNSFHEFYAVLKEEIEESRDEFTGIEHTLNKIWKAVKSDTIADHLIINLNKYTNQCIKELIQVLAMINKLKIVEREKYKTLKVKDDDNGTI